MKGLFFKGFLVLLVPCLMSIFYQSLSLMLEKKEPPFGQLIDVGGYKMHLHAMGEGGPAVVFDSDLGGLSLDWMGIAPEIAKFTKVCTYDRAGYGWSERSYLKRTSQQMCDELHTLLANAHIAPPYILVGHAFGGINALLFAHLFPDEVAGVVLIDSLHEKGLEAPTPHLPSRALSLFLTHVGLFRLFPTWLDKERPLSFLSQDLEALYLKRKMQPLYYKTLYAERAFFKESVKQLHFSGISLGAIPAVVLSRSEKKLSSQEMVEAVKELLSKREGM